MEPISASGKSSAALVVHVLYRFECGGMQTLISECVNRLTASHYRHAIVCLAGYTDEAVALCSSDTRFYDLDRQSGSTLQTHSKLWKLLRRLRPAIVHTYNVATVEYALTAWLARVPFRVHSEHGWNSTEVGGTHARYNRLRRLLRPFIDQWVSVSTDLNDWLRASIGVDGKKLSMVPGGVDTERFRPNDQRAGKASSHVLIGTVGRVDANKNHESLIDAFNLLRRRFASNLDIHLAIIGSGPLLTKIRERIAREGTSDRVWLPGSRSDIADQLRSFDIFVLPSLSEATPVTVLEAMSTALPVVATRVGGLPALISDHETGMLSSPTSLESLTSAISTYVADESLRHAHGDAARNHVVSRYGIDVMVGRYADLYRKGTAVN